VELANGGISLVSESLEHIKKYELYELSLDIFMQKYEQSKNE